MNIGRLLSETARHHADRLALRYGDVELSYRQLDDRVNALAQGLRGLGLRQGDRAAFIAWNRAEIIEWLFACFKLGLVVVPLNARYNADEVAYHLQDAEVSVVMCGPEFEEIVSEARALAPSECAVVAVGAAYEVLLDKGKNLGSSEPIVEVDSDCPCWLFYTSGTTGRPKGAVLTHANLLFTVLGWAADLTPLTPDDVTLHVAPLTHGAGFQAIVAVAKGCTQVIPVPPSVTASETLDLLVAHGVTNTWMVPTQVVRLVAELEARSTRGTTVLPALHSIVYGGAPFHLDDLTTAIQVLGPVLVQLYGQGETPMTATYLRHAEHRLDDPGCVARLASAGVARTGMEVRTVGPDGRPLPDGEPGEIVVRGPTVMKGYWRRPEETADALRDGWLHTGDVGALRDGYLFLLDRMKDLIISGGSNVYAREVEEVLLSHPAVAEVAVIGLPDRDWGERVVAVVVPADGAVDTDVLTNYARQQMAAYKRPKQYEFVTDLPRSAYGKVLKRELRDSLVNV